jgi:hypothetical protein
VAEKAGYPVWKDSTTKPVRFQPMTRRQARQLYDAARLFERQTRQPGQQDGALGRNGLRVLESLLFDFKNYKTGRLDPSQAKIAGKANISERSVARGLATFRRKIDVFGSTVNRFGRAKTAGLPAVFLEGLW